MAAVWGDTFHGMVREPTTAARTVGDAIDLCSNSSMTGVSFRRALGSTLTDHLAGHALVRRHALVSTLSRPAVRMRERTGQLLDRLVRSSRASSGRPARSRPAQPRPTTPSSAPPRARSTYNVHGQRNEPSP